MGKANYYARTLGYGSCIHAFDSRAERDAWIDNDWSNRIAVDAKEARDATRNRGEIVLHDGARVPRSWRWDRLYWDYQALDWHDGVAKTCLAFATPW